MGEPTESVALRHPWQQIKVTRMPFPQQAPRLFTRAGTESNAIGQRGCYGLFRPGLWVYVGKSNDIRARLLEHLAETGTLIKSLKPTHFVAMVTANGDAQETALIIELRPAANQRIG